MKRIQIALILLLTLGCSSESVLTRRAEAEYAHPVRKGPPYWNVYAKKFIYAPAFDFASVEGAASYRYLLRQEGRVVAAFTAPTPGEDLSGIFEDSLWDDFASYSNLTNFTASPYAAYLLTNPKPSEEDVRNACDLIRLSEDQFVHWDKFEGVNAFPPYACEQYFYDQPIDSSIADICDGFLSLYEYNGDKLALAKARSLLNALTRFQEASGRILTLMIDFGGEEPGIEELWLNNTWWTASQLLRLDGLL